MSVELKNGITRFSPDDKDLPEGVQTTSQGLVIENPEEGPSGPYKVLYFIGEQPQGRVIPVGERVKANTDSRFKYLCFEKGYQSVAQEMRKITELNRDGSCEVEADRKVYQDYLFEAYRPVAEATALLIAGRKALFFPPLNGGRMMKAFLTRMGIIADQRDVVKVELKRSKTADGRWFGGVVKENYYPEGEGKFGVAIIADDCLARSVNSLVAREEVIQRYPEIEERIFSFTAVSQEGMETLRSKIGPDDKARMAVPVYATDEKGYLCRTAEEGYPEGTPFVGDMGKWARGDLSRFYNTT